MMPKIARKFTFGLVLTVGSIFAGFAPPTALADDTPPGAASGAVRSEAWRLVAGPRPHTPAVVAGSPPTAVFEIRPAPPKIGSYPPGTSIVGTELRAPYGGFRAWFEVYIRNWDPNQDDDPTMMMAHVKTDYYSWQGENADPPNPGVNLMVPSGGPCVTGADCIHEFGEPGTCQSYGPTYYCAGTYQNYERNDWLCAGGRCEVAACDTSVAAMRCYALARWESTGGLGFFPDDGSEKYFASQVMDIPVESRGTYTVPFNVDETFIADSSAPPIDIPMLAEIPAHVVIPTDGGDPDPGCVPDSTGIPKNRAISLSFAPVPEPAPLTALRVTMVELQNPVPPNAPQYPAADFSEYESGPTCLDPGGCARWVGQPQAFWECNPGIGGTLRYARLQCTAYYDNWASYGLFHVVGAEVMSGSTYHVDIFSETCMGQEPVCTDVSGPIVRSTARHGDVTAPFNPPSTSAQPDGLDVAAMIDKYKCMCGTSTRAQMQVQPNQPELNTDLSALDITSVLDAFKGFAYPFHGPCPCPSTVTCDAAACTSAAQCSGGTCVKTCYGGSNGGDPCMGNANCIGGSCGTGYCRDGCGRCTP